MTQSAGNVEIVVERREELLLSVGKPGRHRRRSARVLRNALRPLVDPRQRRTRSGQPVEREIQRQPVVHSQQRIPQFTPGPSGLWVISLATLMAGIPGGLLATLAAVLPPVLVLLVQRVYQRVAELPAAQGLLDGLMLAIIGVGLVVFTELFVGAGLDVLVVGIAALSLVLALTRRVPAFAIIALAALVGVALTR